MPRLVFETERLAVRIATEEDIELVYALWTSPDVMRHVGFPEGLRTTRREIETQLSKADDSAFEQVLVVELRDSGIAIGQAKLGWPDDEGIAEPDVKLLPRFWGHHYGAEAWRGLVDWQFTHTDCAAVHGTPNVDNVASIKMQEAAGAVRVGEGVFEFPESMRDYTVPVHYYTYRMSRADWEERQ